MYTVKSCGDGTLLILIRLNLYMTFHQKIKKKSLYDLLSCTGVRNTTHELWWKLPIPSKIRVFMWLVANKRILTKKALTKKGLIGSTKCHFCSSVDTVNHLFVNCRLAKRIRVWMGQFQDVFHTCGSF